MRSLRENGVEKRPEIQGPNSGMIRKALVMSHTFTSDFWSLPMVFILVIFLNSHLRGSVN